jgi:hypothetical protein
VEAAVVVITESPVEGAMGSSGTIDVMLLLGLVGLPVINLAVLRLAISPRKLGVGLIVIMFLSLRRWG